MCHYMLTQRVRPLHLVFCFFVFLTLHHQWLAEFAEPGAIRELMDKSGMGGVMAEDGMASDEKDEVRSGVLLYQWCSTRRWDTIDALGISIPVLALSVLMCSYLVANKFFHRFYSLVVSCSFLSFLVLYCLALILYCGEKCNCPEQVNLIYIATVGIIISLSKASLLSTAFCGKMC